MKKIDRLEICAETRTGSRSVNEDSFVTLEGSDLTPGILGLLAVADGIGGLGSGHVASSSALSTISETFRKLVNTHRSGSPPIQDWLSYCLHKANSDVMRMGLVLPELKGMGTTCTCAVITPSQAHLCNVGDSRAYLWRGHLLQQITEDEWFNDLRNPEKKTGKQNHVTLVNQAIGWQPIITPTKSMHPLAPGDTIMLCTDGLSDSLPAKTIEDILAAGHDLPKTCNQLADEASAMPGADNVTVILARL
jgi:PPM family protein phosphatase